jgi:glutamate formiminotransferase/formiminotetrahydrofolate cyclodeaminase
VLTFVGPPRQSKKLLSLISGAAELINLDQHTGEHPRIGATDVVPFVPISGLTMQDSIQIARHLGRRVGEELKIPVYLYEEAATRPERTNLENIRRGQYEALKNEMGKIPAREPDFGPNQVGPAGATVIGARQPLIAYNVYLSTEDVSISQKIAKTIRFSSGRLRYVKALGMLVEGRAQISMNLTNYTRPVALVQETIRREAARYGVTIHHAELVGLIPQVALVEAAVVFAAGPIQAQQILENKLYAIHPPTQGLLEVKPDTYRFPGCPVSRYSHAGWWICGCLLGCSCSGLVSMVARLTIGKKNTPGRAIHAGGSDPSKH